VHVACRVPPLSSVDDVTAAVHEVVPGAGVLLVDRDPWVPIYEYAQRLNADGPLLIINGDLVLDADWYRVIGEALDQSSGITLCAAAEPGQGREFCVDPLAKTSYSAAPTGELRYAIGASLLAVGSLALLDPARALGDDPWFHLILPELSKHLEVRAAVSRARWTDVGSWSGLLQLEQERHGGSCIGGAVDADATIRRSVVMRDASVAPGAIVEDSVVLPFAKVAAGERVHGCLVSADGQQPLDPASRS
jgi:NDP-sugar pyrophosphorylase family protein